MNQNRTLASLLAELPGAELVRGSAETAEREAAFHGLAKTLSANARLFTHITNVLAKDKEISDRWRGFEDIADSRHLANRVEREVVDA